MYDKTAYERACQKYETRLQSWEHRKSMWDKYHSEPYSIPKPKAPQRNDYIIENGEEPQKNNLMTFKLKELEERIIREEPHKLNPLGSKKSPNSVITIYDLAIALNSYAGKIKPETDAVRQIMIQELREHLVDFLNTTKKDYDPQNETHAAALDKFELACTKVMDDHYKDLAVEPTFWNAIKDLYNDFCKLVGLSPKGCFVDSTLDSTEILKSRGIRTRFFDIKSQGIAIKADNDMENPLTPTL
ncbi:hypothetical protein [Legionella parisiensis]|uniref:Uncharacterized protein n=1 Tax=Legionella parisiensis TaxID=45071 RepID=A0A1E5JWJ3_9GAMM|nr:hypothetical protein [Legionella parisiensis]KTD40477.1 hypothetical protein Lpar_1794 [Legionella parisiensis]OEH48468.1 hypothetical protein lpari_00543 [Legionella parisiensis]STX77088.1 Uncharacterised protein [Legionella parisiensis]